MFLHAESLLREAERISEKLRAVRRDLHRHPELSFQEYRTTRKIREFLGGIPGIRFRELKECRTGAVADLPGESNRIVALRADIDALPITEENTHSYVSRTPGVMHACGHDGHAAILLGAAFLLARRKRPYTVRFLFQPAEETVPGGAPLFVKEGVLDGVEALYGFHLNATSDFGKVGCCDGAVMAGGLSFRITVHGKGGHSAYPDKCANPIFCACDIASSLARIRDCIHPSYPCNIVPVKLISDDCGSRIPDTALLEGRCKFLDRRAEEVFRREIGPLAEGCALKNRVTCEIELIPSFPITWNAPELGKNVVIPAAEQLGLDLTRIDPSMGSDDFGCYAERVPSYYMTFGIRKGEDFPIAHTAHFDFDEKILPVGAAQLCACALLAALP